jgi:hypothetical protein
LWFWEVLGVLGMVFLEMFATLSGRFILRILPPLSAREDRGHWWSPTPSVTPIVERSQLLSLSLNLFARSAGKRWHLNSLMIHVLVNSLTPENPRRFPHLRLQDKRLGRLIRFLCGSLGVTRGSFFSMISLDLVRILYTFLWSNLKPRKYRWVL